MPQTFVAPSGREYEWQGDSQPTQADIDAIVAYENEIVAREKAEARRAERPRGLSGKPEPVVEPFRPDPAQIRPQVTAGAAAGALAGATGRQPPQLPSFRAAFGSDALKSKAAAKFFDKPQAKAPIPKPPAPSPRQAIDDLLRRAFEERAIVPRQGETQEQFQVRQAIAQKEAQVSDGSVVGAIAGGAAGKKTPQITTIQEQRRRGIEAREVPPEELEQAVFEEMIALPEDELRALVDERRTIWERNKGNYTAFKDYEQAQAALEEKLGLRRLLDPINALRGLQLQAHKAVVRDDIPATERLMALVNTVEGVVTIASLGSKSVVAYPAIHGLKAAGRVLKPALVKALQAAGKYTSSAKVAVERAVKSLDDKNMAAFRNALDRLDLTDAQLEPVVDDVVKHVEDLSAKLDDATAKQVEGDVPGAVYRSAHQIDTSTSRNVGDIWSIDDDVARIRGKYGLTNSDHKDIKRLKKIIGKPDDDVVVYRASPVNELNSGDWVTTDLIYANDIKRQNGGRVYKYTVKVGDLRLPANLEDNPSSARFSAFQFIKTNEEPGVVIVPKPPKPKQVEGDVPGAVQVKQAEVSAEEGAGRVRQEAPEAPTAAKYAKETPPAAPPKTEGVKAKPTKPPVGKEPWEMMPGELFAQGKIPGVSRGNEGVWWAARVDDALKAGKRVPDDVVERYLAAGRKLPKSGLHPDLAAKYAKETHPKAEPPVGKEPWEIRYDKGVAVGATRGDVRITKVREPSRKSSRGLEQGGEWFQITIDGVRYRSRLLGNVQAWADQQIAAKYAKETPPAAPAPKPTGEVTHGDWTKGPNDSWRRGEYTVEPFAAGQWSIHGPGQRSGYWSGKVVGSLDHAKALVDADIADNPSQTFASIKAGAKPTGGVGKAHKGAEPPEPPAPKPPTGTPANKVGDDGLESALEGFKKAATPTTGGAGSKKRGAVIDPSDTIGGVLDAARSIGGTKKLGVVGEIGTSLFGNTLDRLKALGDSGRSIAHDLSAVFDDAARNTATHGFTVKAAVRAQFGKLYGVSRTARRSLGLSGSGADIATKVERGQRLTSSERKVWDTWVSAVKKIKSDAKQFGVGVMDRVGSHPDNQSLVGTEIRWASGGKIQSGVVTEATDASISVQQHGDIVVLPKGTAFVREQLIDPDKFFPRVLTNKARSELFQDGSQTRNKAIRHLRAKGFAETDEEATEIIREAFGQGVVEIHSPVASRLRRKRTGGLLPGEFYDRDFLSVTEKYIAQASLDIAAARKWGKDYALLTEKLGKLPTGAQEAKALIDSALNPRSLLDTKAHQFAGYEGMYQAISKLTLPTTAFLQVTQAASTYGIMGAKAFVKAAGELAKDSVTGRKIIDTIKLSGVIDQDLLSLLGFADLKGVARDITSIATTPMRWTDRLSRVHASLAGAIHAKDMLRKVSISGGKPKNNAAYRWLEDWAEFSDADIVRMKSSGMTPDDIVRAMSAGVKTQVRTRNIDVAPIMTTPLGRIFMRFKTFSYGQARNIGWTIKEAKRGNFVPSARLLVAGTIAGIGVEGFRDAWSKTREGINKAVSDRDIKELARAWGRTELPEAKKLWSQFQDGITKDDVKGIAGYVLDKLLDAGTLGAYGLAIEHVSPKDKWKKPLEPVSARLPQNITDAIVLGFKNEKQFVSAMKESGIALSKKEILWVREVYKIIDGETASTTKTLRIPKELQ